MEHFPFQNERAEFTSSSVTSSHTGTTSSGSSGMESVSLQVSRISFQELSKNQNRTLPSALKIRGVFVATNEENEHIALSREVIDQSYAELQIIEDKLEELKAQHSIFFAEHQMGGDSAMAQDRIKSFHSNVELLLKQHVENAIKIFHTIVLDSYLLDKLNNFHQRVRFLYHQFAIYQQELLYFLSQGSYCCFSKLFIISQPEPHVIFKGKVIETPISVALLSGCFPNFEIADTVVAKIMDNNRMEYNHAGAKEKLRIENHVQRLECYQRQATFNSIKINVSSRMMLMHLTFSVKIKQNKQVMVLESEKTNPVIVITHENQWVESQIKLFTENCFQSANRVSWCCFINNFHNQFLTLTKQNKTRPDRALSLYEIRYLHKKWFRMENHVDRNEQAVAQYLQWMGSIQRTIHFKRHIQSMWSEGFIFPLLSKRKAEKCLESQGVGTFVIRFSESQGGLFAVAYVSEDQTGGKVKHYLVKSEELSSNKSLADFIRHTEHFQYILVADVQNAELARVSKDCLQKYFTKKKTSAQANGYIDVLI